MPCLHVRLHPGLFRLQQVRTRPQPICRNSRLQAQWEKPVILSSGSGNGVAGQRYTGATTMKNMNRMNKIISIVIVGILVIALVITAIAPAF
jgi:hypothetical protein